MVAVETVPDSAQQPVMEIAKDRAMIHAVDRAKALVPLHAATGVDKDVPEVANKVVLAAANTVVPERALENALVVVFLVARIVVLLVARNLAFMIVKAIAKVTAKEHVLANAV
ncbi:MAG: hypothetical protein K6E73_07695 [Bacteroidales bacterium]|nr:hypothetical protein [Bacteroidales bacterium]